MAPRVKKEADVQAAPVVASEPEASMVLTAGMGVDPLSVVSLDGGAENSELKPTLTVDDVDLSALGSMADTTNDLNKRAAGFVAELPLAERIAIAEALARLPASPSDHGATRFFEARSNILHDGVETAFGGEIELDRTSFDQLKAAGAVAGDWPDDD